MPNKRVPRYAFRVPCSAFRVMRSVFHVPRSEFCVMRWIFFVGSRDFHIANKMSKMSPSHFFFFAVSLCNQVRFSLYDIMLPKWECD